jgi:hypothetical protein
MPKCLVLVCLTFLLPFILSAQPGDKRNLFVWESTLNFGYIVRNSPEVPHNKMPIFLSLNPSVQTRGRQEWHQFMGYPRVGCKLTLGYLGSNQNLGYLFGLTPNMTFNAFPKHWYSPEVNLGLGIAYFNKPFDEESNPGNLYIGSPVTVMAEAAVQIQPRINEKTSLLAGLRVVHCSNSHYQVPNLGMNIITAYVGILINTKPLIEKPEPSMLNIPKSRIHLNFRSGIGIHELAKTVGPVGTPKYAIYVNDIYLSKRYGKLSNVHAGLEVKYYNSFYNYIVDNDFYPEKKKIKATVFTAFLAHELMIKRFSLVTQGGINLYNKFYSDYMNQFLSERGFKLELKKIFSTRLGVQYYLLDPKYCSRTNVFLGAYIKANFGQADFICFQAGVTL